MKILKLNFVQKTTQIKFYIKGDKVMKCFNHHDRDAFGIDIITGKGLCLECLEENKGFIIEKNSKISKLASQHLARLYKSSDPQNLLKIFKYIMLTSSALYFTLAGYEYFVKSDIYKCLDDFILGCVVLAALFIVFSFSKILKREGK